MDLDAVLTPGLGDTTYVLASGGEAILVDPQRDVGRFLDVARARGARLRLVLETHVHNDFVSGALEGRAATGAEIGLPAGGGYEFPHRPLAEGDEISLGELRLVAMETPGHTPEHLSYLVYEADRPVAVFTGGSLMVAGAGRTDLLGTDRADELARLQYRSLRRLAALPDDVAVLPTHGAGSFCGAGPAPSSPTSTMGAERAGNRALEASDEEGFVRRQLSGLPAYPTYYSAMAPINRRGPEVTGGPAVQPGLTISQLVRLLDEQAWLIDGRTRTEFARAHVAGSLNVELADDFGSYVGWVVPFGQPIALIVPEPEGDSAREAAVQLFRIGYDRVAGYLEGGVDEWQASGRPVRSYPVTDVDELCRAYRSARPPSVLDVRQRSEWERGHIPGSRHLFVGDLAGRVDQVPAAEETWAICATGHRASLAASLLDAAAVPVRLVARGGVQDWLRDCPPAPA